MGGSLAMALRPYLPHLTLVDTNLHTLQQAQPWADVVTADFATGIAPADWIILATPARTILHLLAELPTLKPTGCLVLDLGSTKTEICLAMEQLPDTFQAIGGHPMCGKETAGFAAATPSLFQNQTFILCHTSRTTSQLEQLTLEMLSWLGASPLFLPPTLHDELVAAVSHLPYVVSAVLMQTIAAQHNPQAWQVSASGFRDTTRLAGSDPHMMLDILLMNKTAVLAHIEQYQSHLTILRELLLTQNETALANWLIATQQQHHLYRASGQQPPP